MSKIKQNYIKYYVICNISNTKNIDKSTTFKEILSFESDLIFKQSKEDIANEFFRLHNKNNSNGNLKTDLSSLKVFELKINKENIEKFFNDIILRMNATDKFKFKYYGIGSQLYEYSFDYSSDLFKYFKTKKDITQEIKSNLIFT